MTYLSTKKIKSKKFKDAADAIAAVKEIYERNIAFLYDQFIAFSKGEMPSKRVRAYYPYVRIERGNANNRDPRLSYGFLQDDGIHSTTLTRPDIFEHYYIHQLETIIQNHECAVEVGESYTHIPLHFALGEDFHLENDLSGEMIESLPRIFDLPNLDDLDDQIANCVHEPEIKEDLPLSLFPAPRVDVSLMRLRHYCGTSSKHFQNYVIFTNYQFYIDEFIKISKGLMDGTVKAPKGNDGYTEFVMPGDHVVFNQEHFDGQSEEIGFKLGRMPQMPAYHLKRADGNGITMINIGVGPSNAKTITDHVAVLRPHAWLMLGHCAGLRQSQSLGDYVLAHGYLRLDNVLNKDLPPEIPIPPLAEMQQALEMAVSEIIGLEGYDRKKIMRTGTVATIDDRNWELQPKGTNELALSMSRAIGLDMESATIAANGFRFRVPYGTLLCVSDKPLHGQLKLPGMADSFYRERVGQHLQVGLLAMAILRDFGPERLHSRKLRAFNEVAFQ